jgi:ketosteroid isomerase-like protein
MSAEENMALARRLMEARVKGDVDAVDEMLAPNFVSHARLLPDQAPDREGAKWAVAQLAAAFSKARVVVEDQVAQGDKVVTRFVVHSTHDQGELMGVAPTGREIASMAIFIHRISKGKIAEEWGIGTMGWKLRGQRLEQERIERELVEQELGGTNHSAGITPQGDPHIRRLADCSLLPARQGGGRRLLRRLRSPRGTSGSSSGRRHR